jgi:putative membrane protein
VQLLIDYMGACQRIRRTPLPFAYVVHLRRSIAIYCATLPFAVVDSFGWLTPVVCFLTAFFLLGIEDIGIEIEDPFGDDPNDLPLERICTNIEKDLNAILSSLPAKAADPALAAADRPA